MENKSKSIIVKKELLFKFGEANVNGRSYEKESFSKALSEAVEKRVPVYFGEDYSECKKNSVRVGTLKGIEGQLVEGEIPQLSFEITDSVIIDYLSNIDNPIFCSTASIGKQVEGEGDTYLIEEVENIFFFTKNDDGKGED